jgi:large subunit ribosomal protein L3
MLKALLGRKVGMTQIFTERGNAIPVTVIEVGPCTVTQFKTLDRDGYEAVQIGFGKKKNATRPELGHLGHNLPQLEAQKKRVQQERARNRQEARARGESGLAADAVNAEATDETETEATETPEQEASAAPPTKNAARRAKKSGLGPFQILREVEAQEGASLTLGQVVAADIFALGEQVDVIGTTKGKGFAGVMKRHGFKGGQRTHGQSDRLRAPGSIGAGNTPGRVLKGTRMGGRMGSDRRTIKALEVVQADKERNLLVVKGSIPGPNGGIVLIRKQGE